MAKNLFIVGATGNIGIPLINYLLKLESKPNIYAGVRNVEKAKSIFKDDENLKFLPFDFDNPKSFNSLEHNIDCVFLLRPPHISDIDKYFAPLISKIKALNIPEVVFLSVQRAEKSKIIPHHKIEQLIITSSINYAFIRPSYFMQNLTTTLWDDLKSKSTIILPAGKAKFNWIDIENIAEATASVIDNFPQYKNKALEITGTENRNFYEVVSILNETLGTSIQYQSVNPFKFYQIKKQQGVKKGMIIVMIMLHFIPRLQRAPKISLNYENITGKKPISLKEFFIREKTLFLKI